MPHQLRRKRRSAVKLNPENNDGLSSHDEARKKSRTQYKNGPHTNFNGTFRVDVYQNTPLKPFWPLLV
jgi:hypothetical protein